MITKYQVFAQRVVLIMEYSFGGMYIYCFI